MGTTAFYAWPYPDPTATVDVARDIKALADKLETIKDGLVIPNGTLEVQQGQFRVGHTGASQGYYYSAIYLQRNINSKLAKLTIGLFNEDVPLGMELYTNNAYKGMLQVVVDPVTNMPYLRLADSAGVNRQVPFAQWAGFGTITISAASAGSQTVTFPANRFTQIPSTVVTIHGNNLGYMVPYVTSSNLTSAQISARHVDATVGSYSLPFTLLSTQMLPTAAPWALSARETESGDAHTVTCHTEGCENVDVPIEVRYTEGDVSCGPCGQAITDID